MGYLPRAASFLGLALIPLLALSPTVAWGRILVTSDRTSAQASSQDAASQKNQQQQEQQLQQQQLSTQQQQQQQELQSLFLQNQQWFQEQQKAHPALRPHYRITPDGADMEATAQPQDKELLATQVRQQQDLQRVYSAEEKQLKAAEKTNPALKPQLEVNPYVLGPESDPADPADSVTTTVVGQGAPIGGPAPAPVNGAAQAPCADTGKQPQDNNNNNNGQQNNVQPQQTNSPTPVVVNNLATIQSLLRSLTAPKAVTAASP